VLLPTVERHYFALDLKDDPQLIGEYENWHDPKRIWPEVIAKLNAAGVRELEIFRCGNRLVMMIDAADPGVLSGSGSSDWETLMWNFQQPLPFAPPGQKWVPMRCIFSLQHANREQRNAT
jgi:L-rhamnose mutarotase